MAVYLLYRIRPEDRNPSGIQAAIVTAADESTARSLATAAAPNGSTKVPSTWMARNVTTLPEVVWLEGDAITLLGLTRGGDPV